MIQNMYELLWLFFMYSFFGWALETAAASGKKKQFVNRGFFSGPVCFIYGFAAVWMAVSFEELKSRPVYLFIGCTVLATACEWFFGKLLEHMHKRRWWDYSNRKWNYNGYICLGYSLLWGVLGMLAMYLGNEVLLVVYGLLPHRLMKAVLWILCIGTAVDGTAVWMALHHLKKQKTDERVFQEKLKSATGRLAAWITKQVERRVNHAYPEMEQSDAEAVQASGKFAEGCGFYKLFWLLVIGALLGDFTETIFCRVTAGVWMSRSSLVWGPFSMVWGIALCLATALLHRDRNKPDSHIFLIGTFLGGAYEYVCSVFTEKLFGVVFWDYSEIPFNLGGRINLLYCFFWGIAAVVWIKIVYPKVSDLIEGIPGKIGVLITWVVVVFMSINIGVSVLALARNDLRSQGLEPQMRWEEVMDRYFDEERMQEIYPNAIGR